MTLRIGVGGVDTEHVAAGPGHGEAEETGAPSRGHVGGNAVGVGDAVTARARAFARLVHGGERPATVRQQRDEQVAAPAAAPDAHCAGVRKAAQVAGGEVVAGVVLGIGIGDQLHHAVGCDGRRRKLAEVAERADERVDEVHRLLLRGGGCGEDERGNRERHASPAFAGAAR